jgi:UDP-N-acetylglucosamine diphosphorylase/glucosamine-1-phosphate N-acetyltransferase
MNIILFDDATRLNLLPLTHTRPVCELRCGINTISQKWKRFYSDANFSFKTEHYLQEKFPINIEEENLFINGSIFPNNELVLEINNLQENDYLYKNELLVACKLNRENVEKLNKESINEHIIDAKAAIERLEKLSDIFSKNEYELPIDFERITNGRTSQLISNSNTIIGDVNNIFIEEGAIVEASILNTTSGKIHIGKNAEIMEGCMVRGPFALGESAQLKMGTKIYGATTIGDGCKVGGEVNNSVFLANSSKAHDGFIGNSVIGEWCNIGADSNNSNLKNNYEEVKLWSEHKSTFIKTGLQFCGLILADHSKCGINTMFNTGTVVGVSANVFGAGFPRNFIPSFSWGGAQGFTTYTLDKAIATAEKVFARRKIEFDEIEKNIFTQVFELTKGQR